MDKKSFKDYFTNNFLNKERRFSGSSFIETKIIKRNSESSENNGRELILKIKTNSESPIQKDMFWENAKWKEIIDANAFDESLKSIPEIPINSYIDHDMSIRGLIASTANSSLRIEKKDDGIYGFIKEFPSTPDLKKAFDWIESGAVKSNSFIFQPLEVEFKNEDIDGETVEIVIHKKAKLLSIDPVIAGFYPQNDCEVKNAILAKEEKKNMNLKTEYKKLIELAKSRKLSEEENARKKELAKLILKSAIEEEDEKEEKNLGSQTKESNPENKEEEVNLKDDDEEAKNLGSQTKDDDEEVIEIDDDDFNNDDDTPDGKKDEVQELKKDKFPESNLSKSQIINQKFRNGNIQNIIQERKQGQKTNMNYSETQKRFLSITENKREDFKNSHNENVNKFLDTLPLERQREILKEINLISNGNIFETRADGSSYINGLSYISIINDPEVFTELEKILPEINGARIINLDSLDKVKKDILLPTSLSITELKEGEDSQIYKSDTIAIEFLPRRFSIEIQNNAKLTNSAEVLEKETSNGKSSIISKIRFDFYQNLVKHKDEDISTLISATGSTYTGGITKDSITTAEQIGKITFKDFDKIIDNIVSDYGVQVQGNFNILMHPTTWTALVDEYNKSNTPAWNLIDRTKKTYRDINIITANEFPYTNTMAEVPVVIFVRKDAIVLRGLSFVLEDNIYNLQSKALLQRFVSTRGEIKLIDPYLNTFAIKFSASTAKNNASAKLNDVKTFFGKDEISKITKQIENLNKGIEVLEAKNPTKEKDLNNISKLKAEVERLTEELKNNQK